MAAMVVGCQSANNRAELQRQYDAAFQDMLRQPANLDVLFKFATVAEQIGDNEGAISALERMLLLDPNLARVQLELGVLYYNLRSYEMAQTYLDLALRSPDLPPDIRKRAEQFQARVQKQ
jgi:tetratricopeptide (TPR) repeat protein